MSRLPTSLWIAIALSVAIGCGRSVDPSPRPAPPHRFLGIAEDETSNEGPVGLIGGQPIQVSNVSKVQEVPYSQYKQAMTDSKVIAEERHAGFVYWAVKEERDVHFENATAWVTVLERFKARLEK